MALEYIPTRTDQGQFPDIQTLITTLQRESDRLDLNDGVLYYGWPKFQDYEAVGHPVDLALLTRRTGLLLIRRLANPTPGRLEEADDSISQAAATAEAQMLKSAALRDRRRRLKFNVIPILYVPGHDELGIGESEIKASEASILRYIEELAPQGLSESDLEEARSILEGAKALGRGTKRIVENPAATPAAWALSVLEGQLAHPSAHMHIGRHTENRWPFSRLLNPLTFTMMITKMYYPERWGPSSEFYNGPENPCLDKDLIDQLEHSQAVHEFSELERRSLHFTSR